VIPRLHIVTDDAILNRADFIPAALDLLLNLQHRIALHIRARNIKAIQLYQTVTTLLPKAETARTLLLVNDRVDVALTTDARGVHLGARSLPVATVRAMSGPRLAIGYSAHSAPEATDAERDGADFVFAGSIYPTASHPGIKPAGLELLANSVDACSKPVLAIGGVTPDRVSEVLRTGAYGVAVIGAIWGAADPVHAAEQFVKLLES
jgi:thiamine-phosphate diphosphorylase